MDGSVNVIRDFLKLSEEAQSHGMCVCVKDRLYVSPLADGKTDAFELADIDGNKPDGSVFDGNIRELDMFLRGLKAGKELPR